MAILGLRDSESFLADRFLNWRRTILLEFPNGSAPLTALLSLTTPQATNDPSFNWYEKSLASQTAKLTASYTNVATSIAVVSAEFRVGHILMNQQTKEIMQVTAVSADGLTLTVARGNWTTVPVASVGADDDIIVVGNANAEGADSPNALTRDPSAKNNLTQIFRSSIEITGTAMKTAVKWDRTGPYREQLREALNFHSIEMEKAFLFGEKAQYVDPATGETIRTTGGIESFVDAANKESAVGNMSTDVWEGFLERAFRFTKNKNRQKLALCGSIALKGISQIARKSSVINLVPEDDTFGIKAREYVSPHGNLILINHPLFTENAVWREKILIVDIDALKYRYILGRDTHLVKNVQNNGADKRKDEFKTEAGLEVNHPRMHFLIDGVTGGVA